MSLNTSEELVRHKVLICLNSQPFHFTACSESGVKLILVMLQISLYIHYICPHKLITMAVCCTDKHNSSVLANEDELCSETAVLYPSTSTLLTCQVYMSTLVLHVYFLPK